MKTKYLMGLIPFVLIVIVTTAPLYSASVISPKETSILPGFSVTFNFKDPNYASTTLNYKVIDDDNMEVETGTFDTDANGEGSFTVLFNEGGEYRVQVLNGTTVIATAIVHVTDIVALIMPFLILIITLSIVFGVGNEVVKIISDRK